MAWVRRLQKAWERTGHAVFSAQDGRAGFPFILGRDALSLVLDQIEAGRFSLQQLARVLKAKMIRVPTPAAWQFNNLNTQEELEAARRLWRRRAGTGAVGNFSKNLARAACK